ncbi:hypothetical protein LINPERHAP2_LOCUS623 [Linum perenne]
MSFLPFMVYDLFSHLFFRSEILFEVEKFEAGSLLMARTSWLLISPSSTRWSLDLMLPFLVGI